MQSSYVNSLTPQQRKDYHNQQSKKGAVKIDLETGEVVSLSDFARGMHHAKADAIHKAQVNAAKKHMGNSTYRRNPGTKPKKN